MLVAKLPLIVNFQCKGSLREFIDEFQVQPGAGTLVRINGLLSFFSDAGLALVPDISDGDIDSLRTLFFKTESTRLTTAEVLDLITKGEGNKTEFKSTFFVDRRKYEKVPGLQAKEYRSEEVIHSALKTIAAYLNTEGGILLIGVSDDGRICGIDLDHILPGVANEDLWQLSVRSQIEAGFKDGKTSNPYISIDFESVAEARVVVIRVLPKPSTVFLKSSSEQYALYVRNGNRTDRLDITQAEEFFKLRWERALAK